MHIRAIVRSLVQGKQSLKNLHKKPSVTKGKLKGRPDYFHVTLEISLCFLYLQHALE